jgi:hypothetical protein
MKQHPIPTRRHDITNTRYQMRVMDRTKTDDERRIDKKLPQEEGKRLKEKTLTNHDSSLHAVNEPDHVAPSAPLLHQAHLCCTISYLSRWQARLVHASTIRRRLYNLELLVTHLMFFLLLPDESFCECPDNLVTRATEILFILSHALPKFFSCGFTARMRV